MKKSFNNPNSVSITMSGEQEHLEEKEVTVFIGRISKDDDLAKFLKSKSILANTCHPPMNAGPSILEKLKDMPPMYVLATAAIPVLVAALKAYAETHKKRLVLKQTTKGTELDLSGYSVEEIKELEILDIFSFQDKE